MSLFAELRRRNVFRVGVAYLAAAWLLFEVLSALFEVFGTPDWVLKTIVGLLAVGLPIALIFSWTYEITPEGIQRERDVLREDSIAHRTARKLDLATIALLVLVAALVLFDRLVPGVDTPPGAVGDTTEPGPATVDAAADEGAQGASAPDVPGREPPQEDGSTGVTSIGVLPFANMSPDPDNEFFADGIAEELLNLLVDVDGLRVPSRTSSFAFKGQNMDIRDIAAQLRVSHILEGSVRKADNQVRITAQLIEVTTDTHLWSETYDRKLEDIFAIQEEIARSIVRELKGVLRPDLADLQPTRDLEAYTLFLQGRHLFQQRGESLRQAEALLLQAVERDPDFAEAWAVLALTYINFPNYLGVDQKSAHAKAGKAVERAMVLDDSSPDARLALAQIESESVPPRLAKGLAIYEEVIDEHPGHSLARIWYGVNLLQVGYLKQGLLQLERAVELDPAYGLVLDWYARALLLSERFEAVRPPAVRAIQLGRELARVPLLVLYLSVGEMSDMQPLLEGTRIEDWGHVPWLFRLREDPSLLPQAMAFVDERMTGDDEQAAHRVEYPRLILLLVAGDSSTFFRQLERIQERDDTATFMVWLSLAQRHRRDPAMKDWAQKMGLVELWRERGWPDLCRPLGDHDFECD